MIVPALLAAAFVLGSLPFSLWAGKARGVDLRRTGSGNLGATNVYRVLGWRLGVLVFLLDVGKGTAAVVLARALGPDSGLVPALAGFAAVTGHIWTPFAGFRGGKGVATGLGIFLGLAPLAGVLALAVFAGTLTLGGWVSVASTTAAALLPVWLVTTRDLLGPRFPWVLGLSVLLLLLVAWRHRTNWVRLRAGTEQRIWERRPETPAGGAEIAR